RLYVPAAAKIETCCLGHLKGNWKSGSRKDDERQSDNEAEARPEDRLPLACLQLKLARASRKPHRTSNSADQRQERDPRGWLEPRGWHLQATIAEIGIERKLDCVARQWQHCQHAKVPEQDDE